MTDSENKFSWMKGFQAFLKRSIDRPWYGPLIGLISGLDLFIIVIPNDAIMVSSIMVMPKRWFGFGFWIAFGSFLGALLFVYFVQSLGLPWVLNLFPGINETATWAWTETFFLKNGIWLVFLTALSPFVQQPTLILATLSGESVVPMMALYLLGRLIKSLFLAYLASHAPHLLNRVFK